MDKITIRNLEIFANHGVFPEENALGQKFVFTITMHLSTRRAGRSDDLAASIHYGEVSHFVQRFVREHTWKLLETVAERLAEALLLEYPLMEGVDVEIQKPWAPIGLPLETVSVSINKNGLLEILRILIKNSIDYSPKPAHIILQWKNNMLSVKDRGNGISPQDLPYIFDRFYRADKARTRKSAGSGLGLSIAKALAQRLNLSIRAESIEKQGTTISIEFSPESVLYHDRNLNEKPK